MCIIVIILNCPFSPAPRSKTLIMYRLHTSASKPLIWCFIVNVNYKFGVANMQSHVFVWFPASKFHVLPCGRLNKTQIRYYKRQDSCKLHKMVCLLKVKQNSCPPPALSPLLVWKMHRDLKVRCDCLHRLWGSDEVWIWELNFGIGPLDSMVFMTSIGNKLMKCIIWVG